MTRSRRTLAVAIHDIEPATFERCALIRDWLYDHHIERVTLLAIPARDLHPLAERSPEMVSWLIERQRRGDAIAQHGFQHLRSHRGLGRGRAGGTRVGGPYQYLRTLSSDPEAEFLGLDLDETRRAVDAGRRVLKLAGIEPRGFVAPAYAYTPALRQTLSERFQWWAALLGLHRSRPQASQLSSELPAPTGAGNPRELLGPPIALSSSGPLRHALSPALLRAGAVVSGHTLRLDLHPSDLDHPHHMLALEWVIKRATSSREAVTYEELAAAASGASRGPRQVAGAIAGMRYPPANSDGLSGFTSERPA
jgi:predicted deacetylase